MKSGSGKKLKQLIKALERNPEDILTVLSLGEIGNPQAIEPLKEILEGDRREDTRELAAYSLGNVGIPGRTRYWGGWHGMKMNHTLSGKLQSVPWEKSVTPKP